MDGFSHDRSAGDIIITVIGCIVLGVLLLSLGMLFLLPWFFQHVRIVVL